MKQIRGFKEIKKGMKKTLDRWVHMAVLKQEIRYLVFMPPLSAVFALHLFCAAFIKLVCMYD